MRIKKKHLSKVDSGRESDRKSFAQDQIVLLKIDRIIERKGLRMRLKPKGVVLLFDLGKVAGMVLEMRAIYGEELRIKLVFHLYYIWGRGVNEEMVVVQATSRIQSLHA